MFACRGAEQGRLLYQFVHGLLVTHALRITSSRYTGGMLMGRFLSFLLFFLAMSGVSSAQAAFDEEQEIPAAIAILAQGSLAEQDTAQSSLSLWQAAVHYCEAARLGSPEGQFRLGILYAFGRGVPENRAWAAALFSVASQQGHLEAMNMLETISLGADQLPPCVVDGVLPDKPTQQADEETLAIPKISLYVDNLPKEKRWAVSLVKVLAGWYHIDPSLALSIVAVESNFQHLASSSKDAMGLMQLIPQTADRFNVRNAFNATQNVKGGLAYLRWLLARYQGDVKLVAAAYNAGEGTVDRYKGIPPYPETKDYVKKVLNFYQQKHHPFDAAVTQPSGWLLRLK